MNQTSRILEEVKKAVCGKDRVLVWVLTVLLARGHVLLEDIPGVGKTTMALAFSRALGLDYGRVQFTPDVLPSDITGYSVYQKESGKLVYQPGAVLCNLFLADELNRATSRTQSALLEAMEEGQVTVDGVSLRSRSRLSSLPRKIRRVPLVRSCCRTHRWTALRSGCPSAIRSRRTNAAWCSRGRASTRCRQSSRSCPGRSSLPCRMKPPRFTSKKSW